MKNIEKQGIRPGYIVGGILSFLIASILVVLYLPTILQDILDIALLWDSREILTGFLGEQITGYIFSYSLLAVLAMFLIAYLFSLFAHPSVASTFFRLSCLLSVLGLSIPQIMQLPFLQDFASTELYLQYHGYLIIGIFIAVLVLYVLGIIFRAVQKYNQNRPSTLLAFASTFWLILFAIFALSTFCDVFAVSVPIIDTIWQYCNQYIMGIFVVFLVISVAWMFITVPHRVKVNYNTEQTSGGNYSGGRPTIRQPDEDYTYGRVAPEQRDKDLGINEDEELLALFEDIPLEDIVKTQPVTAYQAMQDFKNPQSNNELQPQIAEPENNVSPTESEEIVNNAVVQPVMPKFDENNMLIQQQPVSENISTQPANYMNTPPQIQHQMASQPINNMVQYNAQQPINRPIVQQPSTPIVPSGMQNTQLGSVSQPNINRPMVNPQQVQYRPQVVQPAVTSTQPNIVQQRPVVQQPNMANPQPAVQNSQTVVNRPMVRPQPTTAQSYINNIPHTDNANQTINTTNNFNQQFNQQPIQPLNRPASDGNNSGNVGNSNGN